MKQDERRHQRADPDSVLEHGRESYERDSWAAAYESLSAADRAKPLAADDLELLATSAYMLGREADYLDFLERAHLAHVAAGRTQAALRCAFWIGVNLARRGEMSGASGWLGRARRLLEHEEDDRIDRGYLLLPVVFEQEARGDLDAAAATAGEAAAIGERDGDADLFALAAHEQGRVLIKSGRIRDGSGLLDEAMVAVTAGELSPIVSGIVYCGVIVACRAAYDVRRAQEWTAALTRWCERQPDLVAFTGRCLVHRAELMQLHGAWTEALEEARRAGERSLQGQNMAAAGEACYRQGEIQRMLGRHGAAESAYREARQLGREPQPGLALLRLAQGKAEAAKAAIRRVVTETAEPGERAMLLPAYVEIMQVVGDLEAMRAASDELHSLAAGHESEALGATAAQARGALELATGEAQTALVDLRHAHRLWHRLEAPYEASRVRELIGLACRALGDEDTAALELEAARSVFEELKARRDVARIDSLVQGAGVGDSHGLTPRELQVLRLVVRGETNRSIAAELVVSERTIDRHVSNIFRKLDVGSRAAATAYAYEHGLV
jgi:DNA-binding CsgD family transcriptional regulator